MGRKKIYLTEEAKIISKREIAMKYYWKNQKTLREKALERYYKKKVEK
jgi:hypothetical protein